MMCLYVCSTKSMRRARVRERSDVNVMPGRSYRGLSLPVSNRMASIYIHGNKGKHTTKETSDIQMISSYEVVKRETTRER